jgi:hypothetical protein
MQSSKHVAPRAASPTSFPIHCGQKLGWSQSARADGFQGPVLYVHSDVKSFHPFHEVVDQEVKWQGPVDITGARMVGRFAEAPSFMSCSQPRPRRSEGTPCQGRGLLCRTSWTLHLSCDAARPEVRLTLGPPTALGARKDGPSWDGEFW